MNKVLIVLLAVAESLIAEPTAQPLTRKDWGAPLVNVSHLDGQWVIAGRKQKVVLTESNLALEVRAGSAVWNMVASGTNDMLVKSAGTEFSLRLADAKSIEIERYDTGFKTGVKLALSDWQHNGKRVDVKLHLTICLEGADDELVFTLSAE
jgi:hypothetical protein